MNRLRISKLLAFLKENIPVQNARSTFTLEMKKHPSVHIYIYIFPPS